MADGPAMALQIALVAALRADPGVSGFVGARVYDEPPDSVVFPYIRIGRIEVAPLRLSGQPADDTVTFSIEAHWRPDPLAAEPGSGRVAVTRIAEAVRACLDEREHVLTPAGFSVDWCFFITQSVARAADGKTYTAISAFDASLAALP